MPNDMGGLFQHVFGAAMTAFNSGNFNLNFGPMEDIPVTISAEQMSQFPRRPYRQVMDQRLQSNPTEQPYSLCPITREAFDDDTEVLVLPCGHYYSIDGISQWLTENNPRCPCCNSDVREMTTH